MGLSLCKYNVQYLREMLEKERDTFRQLLISYIIQEYGDKIDHADKIEPSGFCLFHDPNAYREKPDEVRREFFKWLE